MNDKSIDWDSMPAWAVELMATVAVIALVENYKRVRAGGCPGEEALRALRAGLGSLAQVSPVHAAVVARGLLRREEVAPRGAT